MRVRYIDRPDIEGNASRWNPAGFGEVILWFDDGSATSEEANLLEPVYGDTRESWYAQMTELEP